MKKILSILVLSLFVLAYVPLSASGYTYSQCLEECRLQGGTDCTSQCSFIAPDSTACGLLGCGNIGIDISRFDNLNLLGIISLISSLIFGVIIIIGIFYVIKGSLKIMRSEGEVSKIEEGNKIFKGVFIGIVMILGGILGLVLMLALFDAGGVATVNPELPPLN